MPDFDRIELLVIGSMSKFCVFVGSVSRIDAANAETSGIAFFSKLAVYQYPKDEVACDTIARDRDHHVSLPMSHNHCIIFPRPKLDYPLPRQIECSRMRVQ